MSAAGLQLAIRFHETYERLAPSFGYETRPDTKSFDPTSANGRLMVAVCSELLPVIVSDTNAALLAAVEDEARRYAGFYSPGTDGRNTFVIFADCIAGRAALALTTPTGAPK